MSDLVGNSEEQFSHGGAHIDTSLCENLSLAIRSLKLTLGPSQEF